MIIRKFYEGADGGGGGSTLMSIIDQHQNGGSTEPAETPEQIAAKAQTALVAEATDEQGNIKPGYIKDAATGIVTKDASYTAPVVVEGLNADGTVQDGYTKNADGTVTKNAESADDLTDEEWNNKFFADVQAITGHEIQVEYPEGVDPVSPQGTALRDMAIMEYAALQFEESLSKRDPRGYAYLLHRQAGLADADFLNENKGFVLPDKAAFDASADLHTAVFRHDLRARGNDDDTIDMIVKDAIAKGKLKEKADASYTRIQAEQNKDLENATRINTEKEQAATKAITGMKTKLDETISTATRFVIPDTDKPAFKQFILENMRFDAGNGTFSIVQAVEPESLIKQIEALFFQFKKGDLKSLIVREAKTQVAQSIRLKTKPNPAAPGSGSGGGGNDKNFISLSDVTKQHAGQQ